MTSSPLRGVFPVVATPFHADGTPDHDGLRRIIEYVVASGADGAVFPGMASEATALSTEERGELTRLFGESVAGRVPIVVGASAATPEACAAFAEAGAPFKAAAAMVMAPAAIGDDVAALTNFYAEIGSATSVPLMLQNAPKPFGAGLDVETVIAVVTAIPAIRYVKEETMPCGQRIARLLASRPDSLDGVLGGAGGRYILDELNRGAIGTMPACELTEIHVAMVRAYRAGDHRRARDLFNRSLPLLSFQAVFRMAMTKEVLRRRGLIGSTLVRAPGPHLDAGDIAEMNVMLDEIRDLLSPPLGVHGNERS